MREKLPSCIVFVAQSEWDALLPTRGTFVAIRGLLLMRFPPCWSTSAWARRGVLWMAEFDAPPGMHETGRLIDGLTGEHLAK